MYLLGCFSVFLLFFFLFFFLIADSLAQLDVQIFTIKSETRKIEREKYSYEARIEALEEQREEYRIRLQEYAGNDDLLRVSFKRYDTDASGNLDVNEIYAAMSEILAIE